MFDRSQGISKYLKCNEENRKLLLELLENKLQFILKHNYRTINLICKKFIQSIYPRYEPNLMWARFDIVNILLAVFRTSKILSLLSELTPIKSMLEPYDMQI